MLVVGFDRLGAGRSSLGPAGEESSGRAEQRLGVDTVPGGCSEPGGEVFAGDVEGAAADWPWVVGVADAPEPATL